MRYGPQHDGVRRLNGVDVMTGEARVNGAPLSVADDHDAARRVNQELALWSSAKMRELLESELFGHEKGLRRRRTRLARSGHLTFLSAR